MKHLLVVLLDLRKRYVNNLYSYIFRCVFALSFNKEILYVLYRSKNVEIQGSGIRKVLELCKKNNIKYTYYNNEYGFRFTFYRKNVTSNVTYDDTINFQKLTILY